LKKSLIVIITPSSSQPRYHKRISVLSKLSDTIIFTFRRGLYETNIFQPGVRVHDFGRIPDKNYLQRIFPFIRAIYLLSRNLPSGYKSVQFYTFNVDGLLIAKLAGIKKGYFEVGDIFHTSRFNFAMKRIEKLIVNGVSGLILTSSKYYTEYYKNILTSTNKTSVYIIENKVDSRLEGGRPTIKTILNYSPITIGLVGLLRYPEPILRLVNFVKRYPDLTKLKVFGDGHELCKSLISKNVCENIEYFGSYKSPNDLLNIYNQIDVNYVVYDYRKINVRLALPNKLYESAYFGVPIICGVQTYLGFLAKKWGIGGSIRIENQHDFDNDMMQVLNYNWLIQASTNCFAIANDKLLDNSENTIIKFLNKERL